LKSTETAKLGLPFLSPFDFSNFGSLKSTETPRTVGLDE